MVFVTLVSVVVAFVMSVVAWRVSLDARRRSRARVAALALEIHATPSADSPSIAPTTVADIPLNPPALAGQPQELFRGGRPSSASGSHWRLALAAGAFVIASVAAAAIVFSGESPSAAGVAREEPARAAVPAPVAVPLPLELVALSHEQEGDRLTVRGLVRNPASGVEMDRLTAVVFLFDRNGGFLTSGRAAVASSALIPGGESTFVVTVPASDGVGRYRVSFRSDDRVISHVDKRGAS